MGVTALAAISGGLQLMQGIQGAQQNKAMAKSAAAQTAANIQNEQNRAAIAKAQLEREQSAFSAKQRVAGAASGATLGSFDALFEDTQNKSLVDIAMLDYESKLNQESLRYGGAVQQQEYKTAAKSSLLAGVGGAMSSYGDYRKARDVQKANTAAKGG